MPNSFNIWDRMLFFIDFDGTLVDSYTCLPQIYAKIAKKLGVKESLIDKFVKRAIELEDLYDARGIYDKKPWWPNLFEEFGINIAEDKLKELIEFFFAERIRLTRVPKESFEFLELLKKLGKIVISLSGTDGIPNKKLLRLKRSGLFSFFDEIYIVGENVSSRVEAIDIVLKKYKLRESNAVFIDDKPSPINEVKGTFPEILAVKIEFLSVIRMSWMKDCKADLKVKSVGDLIGLLKQRLGHSD